MTFYLWKNDVIVPLKRNKHKNLKVLKANDEKEQDPDPDPDPLVKGTALEHWKTFVFNYYREAI